MNIASISIEHKEKRSTLEVIIYHDYLVRRKNGGYDVMNKETVISIEKPTKKELIKKAKEEERRRSNENY